MDEERSSPSEKVPEPAAEGRVQFDVAGANASEAIAALTTKLRYWVDRGRFTKLRIKRGGKPLLPDIPLGAWVAVEAATFFWTGLLRAALFNVVGKVLFEVELVDEADETYRRGLEQFLAGDVDDAARSWARTLQIDPRHARAHLQLGVVAKMRGDVVDAQASFEEAIIHDGLGETRREAEAHLRRLKA